MMRRCSCYVFVALISILLSYPPQVSGQFSRVDIRVGFLPASFRQTERTPSIFTESHVRVTVEVFPSLLPDEPRYVPSPSTKPEWLDLSIFLSTDPDGHETEGQDISGEFLPTYYLTENQRTMNKLWDDGDLNAIPMLNPSYNFDIVVPASYFGKTICICPVVREPPYGPVVQKSEFDVHEACTQILKPTSREDSAYALESEIVYLSDSGEYLNAILLTDSLLAAGWATGLFDAQLAAARIGRLSDQLRYMDLAYQHYGTIYKRAGLGRRMSEADFQNVRAELVRQIERQDR